MKAPVAPGCLAAVARQVKDAAVVRDIEIMNNLRAIPSRGSLDGSHPVTCHHMEQQRQVLSAPRDCPLERSLPHVRGEHGGIVALGSEPRHASSVFPLLMVMISDSVIRLHATVSYSHV